MPEGRLFIGGEFCDSLDGGRFPTINPATELPIIDVDEAGPRDVDAAVSSAQQAFEEWRGLDAKDRGKILWAIGEAVETAGTDLAQLDCVDSGKPINDAHEDVHAAVGMFRYFAGMADKIEGRTIPASDHKLVYTIREPFGVFAAITAWNYPLFNACAKIAPVLAAGNACVLKPAEETPLTALLLAQTIASVDGVPPGLVNVINGLGETTGALLVGHPGISRVTFTGSTATGSELLRNVGSTTIKGLTLELGGKAPVVVFADANLEAAANAIAFSAFFNQGQTCTAATRVIVHRDVHDALLDMLAEQARGVQVGDPSSGDTVLGPLISRSQYEKVVGYLERAEAAGTWPVCGGYGRPLEPGFYLSPTIYDGVPANNEMFQDEIFGPILLVNEFDTVQEAVALANNSRYGLAASVWTRDVFALHRMAKDLRAGIIWSNTLFSEFPGAPAGGVGSSGFGREYGFDTMNEYTQVKTVWVNLDDAYDRWV